MASTYTSNVELAKPASNDTGWGTTVNTNMDTLAALAPIGGLAVKATEVPSSTLNVRVAAGSYPKLDGTVGSYAGTASQAIPASVTRRLWLDDSGTLTLGASYPTTYHIRLATVVSGASTLTSVTDERLTCQARATQPANANQAAAGALTSATLTDSTGGTANTTVQDVTASFSQSILNNNFADLIAQINALRVDVGAARTLANQLRADLVTVGTIKGSA